MAYTKRISAADIVQTAVRMIEANESEEIALRAVAASLGVRAPSLYRYFPHKEALEGAVTDEALKVMLAELRKATSVKSPEESFRSTVATYLRFAREHFALYSFLMRHIPQTQSSAVAKDVWNLLLDAASRVSEQTDDTAAAVATWSFLHGFVTLEHSGAFGASGPKGGLDLGVMAFLNNFRRSAAPVQKKRRNHSQQV